MPPSLREVDCRRQDGRSFCRRKRTAGIGNELTIIRRLPQSPSATAPSGKEPRKEEGARVPSGKGPRKEEGACAPSGKEPRKEEGARVPSGKGPGES